MPASIIGFGTMFLGQRDYHADGSYITTEFITALSLPLLPLRSVRVVETGHEGGASSGYHKTSYVIIERLRPFCWIQVLTVYTTVILSIASLALFILGMGPHGPIYPIYQYKKSLAVALMWLVVLWPMIFGGAMRVIAKRRAGLKSWLPF